jgi:hypothetical protein
MDYPEITPSELQQQYTPSAVYYVSSDSLEYVRRDEPSFYRRIDPILTLIFSMKTREPLGFRLKGFKHYYFTNQVDKDRTNTIKFPMLIEVLEETINRFADKIFEERDKQLAYESALEIAQTDRVTIRGIA